MHRLALVISLFLLPTPPLTAFGQATGATDPAQAPASTVKQFTFGVAGGATVPLSDTRSSANTGYNVTGMLGFNPSSLPFGVRLLVDFNSLGANQSVRNSLGGASANATFSDVAANVVYNIPVQGMLTPYLSAGAGLVHETATANTSGVSVSTSRNMFGFNGGGGLSLKLSGFSVFAETRYHHVNGGDAFLPVVVGVSL